MKLNADKAKKAKGAGLKAKDEKDEGRWMMDDGR